MRPVAYVCMKDSAARARIIKSLERTYAISLQPTGFHLISAIADVIEGKATWRQPMLIVVDAILPGCAGTTIADGLRELGISIPTFVIRDPRDVEKFRPATLEDERTHQGRSDDMGGAWTRSGGLVSA